MNHAYLDPIAAITQPREDFIRYLLTAYPIKDTKLRQKLKDKLEQPGIVWQHPYLEGSQPYKADSSLAKLVEDGILHSSITDLFPKRPLHKHQKDAIAAVVQNQHNIVVATGTGSGKTECFLVPMMDCLLKEEDRLATSGVRALILYPMNALVNDQVKRLRQILCQQDPNRPRIRFGFYTSRTEKEPQKAQDSLRTELSSYDRKELLSLFTETEQNQLNLSTPDRLVNAAVEKIQEIQALSRKEMWERPPHILVTNYSMLEHMLIRPIERTQIFKASTNTFNMLIVDEAHTYDGATGTEVSMLLKRFKVALGQEKGHIRGIATSASLGDRTKDSEVLEFAEALFDEKFAQVIRGNRQEATFRLGQPYALPSDWQDQDILETLSILQIPEPNAPLQNWKSELSYWVPPEHLENAELQANEDFHRFLWFSLKQHPLMHRLINILSQEPQRWNDVVQSSELWQVELPRSLDDTLDPKAVKMAEEALARLLQLGTLARENPDDLPLLPVRLHLLFRSLEGVYGCINPDCQEVYLNERHTCDRCNSPILELGSCAQCGEAYAFTQWDSKTNRLLPLPRTNQAIKENSSIYTLSLKPPGSRAEDEEDELPEEEGTDDPTTRTFSIESRDGWIGKPLLQSFSPLANPQEQKFYLVWHRRKDDRGTEGCYLPKCVACGSRPNRSQAINRFVAYTDAPLEAMIDGLFELLPEAQRLSTEASKRKLLAFSDGRQDAAFFASDFQRNNTETVYRQMVWQAFQRVKDKEETASVNQVTNELTEQFLQTSIPHPDRNSTLHHRSYCPKDPVDDTQNERDCRERAEKRAKELLAREFAIPYARRSSLEAYALLACHLQLRPDDEVIQYTASLFQIPQQEAQIFLLSLTDIIRRSGIVSIRGASNYFIETGGGGSFNRPEMIDAKGRSKRVLFLEKPDENKNLYADDQAFIPRWKKTGEPMQAQNRLGWYFLRIFPTFPCRDDYVALFQKLQSEKILVSETTKKGNHLNWELLNVIQTESDWYQCDRCQQIIHVPGLSKIENPKLNLHACRAYRCTGKLHSHTPEEIAVNAQQHYQQYLIKNRQPLSLRSQEHTAQLGTEELAKRENNFRQGKINLLSCSTTLEMGVDIGELQAVVLRNFPPHVSNYQQRAGRAGRRTDGVAITLMYGQRRPHDRYYFEEPERLIAGTNQIPRLDPSNAQIQQRHIRAELLAAFLATQGLGAEKVRIGDFFDLSHDDPVTLPDAKLPANSMSNRFKDWLYSDQARTLSQEWLERLESSTSLQNFVKDFLEDFDRFVLDQLSDWNQLVVLLSELDEAINLLSRGQRPPLQKQADNLLRELKKVAHRQLHEKLVQASILPIYGFPIDVVRLMTDNSSEFRSSKGKHRLERDRRLALSEYAPGQDIVVDDRVYRSVGVRNPGDLEERYYWVCKFCNHFKESPDQNHTVEECPMCWRRPKTIEQRVHAYRVPKVFITDWTQDAKVMPYLKPVRQPTSQVFLANQGNLSEPKSFELYNLTSSSSGEFFLANRGAFTSGSQAFCICRNCGRDLAELVQQQASSGKGKGNRKQQNTTNQLKTHNHPLTGTMCSGGYERLHLGHVFKSDLLKIEFRNTPEPPPSLFGAVQHYQGDRTVESIESDIASNATSGRSFWHSLTYALLAAAAQELDIRREELDGLFRPLNNGQAELIIYDNVPGGAGYSRRIAERFREVLQKAYALTSTCSCQTSCYDCLRTYSNQFFHQELNRNLVADFLQPIVDKIAPDETLQNFACGSYRVPLGSVADELPVLFRTAQTATIYLPQLQDEWKLNHNAPISWLSLLTDAVNANRNSETPLNLIVHRLPEPNSDAHRFLRKQLEQWLNQGFLKLCQTDVDELPMLAIFTAQGSCVALGLNSKESGYEWLQTRQPEGVKDFQQRLHQLKGRLISAQELEAPDTKVILPNPNWGNLSLAELRQKLGLEACLTGSEISKISYSDRYLYKSGAEILAALLNSENIIVNTQILINTKENSRDRSVSTSERKRQLETALASLSIGKANLKITVYPDQTSRLEHGRILEIWRTDGDHYRIFFDKGVDFIEADNRNSYRIKEVTYIVISRGFDSKNSRTIDK
jgi:ATP-dependent helicase YprA (DUF1998 family)